MSLVTASRYNMTYSIGPGPITPAVKLLLIGNVAVFLAQQLLGALLSLNVVRENTYLLVATAGGYAKRTAIEEYPVQGRGGKGVLTVQFDKRRGSLVGALIVDDDTELYAITSGGGVIRTAARQVRKAGRQTKGVRLMNLGEGDTLIAIARNAEEPEAAEDSGAES